MAIYDSFPSSQGTARAAREDFVCGSDATDAAALRKELKQKTRLVSLVREAIMILDTGGNVISWNQAAERLYGWTETEVQGRSPVELLKTELPRPLAQIENILRREGHWDYELKQTTRDGRKITVASRWALSQDESGTILGRLQLDVDVTKRKRAEQQLRVVSGRLLNLRDEERRRLARDLHDSVGQLLSMTKINLTVARKYLDGADPLAVTLFSESCDLIEQAVSELRTISYLLHPPLLEELGLSSVLSWYATGFSERSRIKVSLDVPKNMGRFSHELEICIFRIVQECLTNVHRHSNSPTAEIVIAISKNQLRLKVEDRGKGMDPSHYSEVAGELATPGVGISGIRERVAHLGGQMQVRSGSWGTAVEALFPLEEFVRQTGPTPIRQQK